MTMETGTLTGYDARLRDLRMRRRYLANLPSGPIQIGGGDYAVPHRPGSEAFIHALDSALQFARPAGVVQEVVDETARQCGVLQEDVGLWEPMSKPVRKSKPRLDIPYIVRAGDRVAYLDLDGVICDDRHRVHHAQERDWGSYFGKMTDDVPWRQGRDLYEGAIIAGWDIAYLTGRREDTRVWTVDWLERHGFDHTLPLVMRPEGQRMPLANLKALIVEETLRYVPEVILYDDDPEVIKAVNQVQGAQAVHCTWHKKEKSLIKKAQF